jgi:hypothetical protein
MTMIFAAWAARLGAAVAAAAGLAVLAGSLGFAADGVSKWGNAGWEFLPEFDLMLAGVGFVVGCGILLASVGAWRLEANLAAACLGTAAALIGFVALIMHNDEPVAGAFFAAASATAVAAVLATVPGIASAIRQRVR